MRPAAKPLGAAVFLICVLVARKGVVRTFRKTTIFRNTTVHRNVVAAHHLRSRAGLAGFFFGTPTAREDETSFNASADEIVGFLGLGAVRDELARTCRKGICERSAWRSGWPRTLPCSCSTSPSPA